MVHATRHISSYLIGLSLLLGLPATQAWSQPSKRAAERKAEKVNVEELRRALASRQEGRVVGALNRVKSSPDQGKDLAPDVEKLLAMTYPDKKTTVEEHVKEMIATIGENMTVRRTATLEVSDGIVGSYMHNQAAPDLGKIGVMVALESAGKNADELANLARMLAMHVAATNPVALDIEGVPAETLEREKAILADKNKGKPPQVLEKILAGGLKSYAKENCLLDQAYIHDPSKSVTQTLKEAEGTVGGPVKIVGFVRYALGEGIEKKEDDFAAEVAAAAGG